MKVILNEILNYVIYLKKSGVFDSQWLFINPRLRKNDEIIFALFKNELFESSSSLGIGHASLFKYELDMLVYLNMNWTC